MDIQQPLILRPSKVKTSGLLVGCLIFVLGGAWIVPNDHMTGWLSIIFFGLCALVFAVQLLPNSSYLRLTSEGFTICSLFRAHSFKWSDVRSFSVGRVGLNKMVMFDFSEHYQDSSRLRKINVGIARHEGGLPDSYGMPHEDLVNLLNQYRRAHSNN